MTITINGEKREFPGSDDFSIAQLLERLELDSRPVLVELDGEALFQRDYALRTVRDGGTVEIIQMVAGG